MRGRTLSTLLHIKIPLIPSGWKSLGGTESSAFCIRWISPPYSMKHWQYLRVKPQHVIFPALHSSKFQTKVVFFSLQESIPFPWPSSSRVKPCLVYCTPRWLPSSSNQSTNIGNLGALGSRSDELTLYTLQWCCAVPSFLTISPHNPFCYFHRNSEMSCI